MKFFKFFLVTLTIFVLVFPADAQKQKAVKTPLVPCAIPLADSPTVRKLKLNLTLLEYNVYVADTGFKPLTYQDTPPFTQQYSLIPKPPKPTNFSPELIEQTKKYEAMRGKKDTDSQNKTVTVSDQSKDVKNFQVHFYGRENPLLYSFQINYSDALAFESDQQIKDIFAQNLKIPSGSWFQIQDPELIKKLIGDAIYQITNFTTKTAYPELKFWQADCNGWRAVYITTLENNGLSLIISNSYVVDNFEKLKAASDQKVLDAKRKKTNETFKP